MHTLVLLRHGQSTWNAEKRFTGWMDVDLTGQGREEAQGAADILKEKGFAFDMAFTSVLKRAIRTLWVVLDAMDLMWIPVLRSWRLNERHYGALQGLNKVEMTEKHGEAQVKIWRRSYATPPPPLAETERQKQTKDMRYSGLEDAQLPASESLQDTVARVLPYWESDIAPTIRAGKRVLIAAHGNSLRALVMHLDQIPESEITELNIPTGIPLVYELDEQLKPIRHYYLASEEALKKAEEEVVNQTKG